MISRSVVQAALWTGVDHRADTDMRVLHTITFLIYVLVLYVGVTSEGCGPKACEVRVRTDAGWVCGRVRPAEDGTPYASFRGVPYGKPPLGERRFKELDPVDPWEGDRDASEDSAACPQKEIIYGRITSANNMSEDCIYLNIHVPSSHLPQDTGAEKKTGLPILVMIHGGGFNSGSGLSDLHGPEYLMTQEVIVISFNYRINVFGFLSLNTTEIPGNMALRDQITLLRWVQRNARAFGGDPDNVTLMGQSAGASCAHLLTLSKATEGLFKKVILMSGTAVPNYFTTSPENAKEIAKLFLSHLGINATEPAEIHRQLVQLPLIDIMHANAIVQHQRGFTTFMPVAEIERPGMTSVLDDTPLRLMAQGRGNHYPVLIGYTDKESEFFRWLSMIIEFLRRVQDNPVILLPPRLLYEYNLPAEKLNIITQKAKDKCFNGTETLDKLLNYIDYLFFKYPALKLAKWRSQFAPTYLYQYSYRSERSLIKEALWSVYEGAAHVEDLTFVFRVNSMLGDYVAFPPKNNDDRMKEWMTTFIANFMRCSNPTCTEDEKQWPRYSEDEAQYQTIQEPYVFSMSEPTAEEVDMVEFFDSIDEEMASLGQTPQHNDNIADGHH